MNHFVVISGCSGGGKSTILAELARRGFSVVEEPGRRIVAEEMRTGGKALPWVDLAAFSRRAMAMALEDRARVSGTEGWVFFDRGLVDAAAALEEATGEPVVESLGSEHRYCRQVFLTPPWPEIYCHDGERQHDLADALAEYGRLLSAYPKLGYEVNLVPKAPPAERAGFILERLRSAGCSPAG